MERRGKGYEPIPDIYQDMLDEWPGSFSSLDVAVKSHFDMMPNVVGLSPKTEAMLGRFRSHGIAVGVVTNGDSKTQWGKLRTTGIAALVQACAVPEDFGTWKPDPAIFRHALVVHRYWIDGYKDLSLIRAPAVVKRQFTRMPSSLRRCCHAFVSCSRVS